MLDELSEYLNSGKYCRSLEHDNSNLSCDASSEDFIERPKVQPTLQEAAEKVKYDDYDHTIWVLIKKYGTPEGIADPVERKGYPGGRFG